MPVPVWNGSDFGLLDEPLDNTTVVSEDIWKKFDLDTLDDHHNSTTTDHRNSSSSNTMIEDSGVVPSSFSSCSEHFLYDKSSCLLESREIRHHDCMWAGLCISKEHNRTLPAKKSPQVHKKVPAGRSLLISRAVPTSTSKSPVKGGLIKHPSVQNNSNGVPYLQQQQQQQQQRHQRQRHSKALESDGDSARSETPPSSAFGSETEEEEEEEEEDYDDEDMGDQIPVFRHDQISINERLSECMSEAATKAVPVSEVTGQLVRRLHYHQQQQQYHDRRKSDEGQCHSPKMDTVDIRNTLSDHCYHLNQPTDKELEYLGLQTPSDTSDEEIDVVTFEKPCRLTSTTLPTCPTTFDQQYYQNHLQKTNKNTSSIHHPPQSQAQQHKPYTVPEINQNPPVRKRGRPPANPDSRKRLLQQQQQSLMKRLRNARNGTGSNYKKKKKASIQILKPSTTLTPAIMSVPSSMTPASSRSSSEDDEFDEDEEKRSLHNNMERQRRIGQRLLLEELRLEVPAVKFNEKAAKVSILREATSHILQLKQMESMMRPQLSDALKQRRALVTRALELGIPVHPLSISCGTDPAISLLARSSNRKNPNNNNNHNTPSNNIKDVVRKNLFSDKNSSSSSSNNNITTSNRNKRTTTTTSDEGYIDARYGKRRCLE